METRDIEPDVYHKNVSGIIYGIHNDDGSTTLTIWQAALKRGIDILLPFTVAEIATTHRHCILFGYDRDKEALAVINLEDCTQVYRLFYGNNLFQVSRHTFSVNSWKGQILMDLKMKFNSHTRIAAMEVAGFYVDPEEQNVFSIVVDAVPFPLNLKQDGEWEFLKEAPIIPVESQERDFFYEFESISQIEAGASHVVMLTKKRKVFVFGNFQKSELGLLIEDIAKLRKRDNPMEFILLKSLNRKEITKISCGFFHTLAMSEKSEIYGWGWNRYGQLGSALPNNVSTPSLISVRIEEGATIKDILAEMDGSQYLVKEPLTEDNNIGFGEEEMLVVSDGDSWDHWLP